MRSIRSLLVKLLMMISIDVHAERQTSEPAANAETARSTHGRRSSVGSRRALPVTMLVLGGAAVVGGAVALAFDQDAIVNTPRGPSSQPNYRETAVPAVIAIAAGAIFAGAGGYVYWKLGQLRATPTIAPAGDGAIVGFVSAF